MKRASIPLLSVLVLASLLAAYSPALDGGFLWDDDAYVSRNPTLKNWDGLKSIWLEIGAIPQYYPLVHSSFWLEFQAWGLNTTGYHAINILLHYLNALLLGLILRRLEIPGSWLVAAIFALHPVHVESVAWITERKNVLSGFFYLSALLTYLRFWRLEQATDEDGIKKRGFYVAALGLFVCALLSKTVTATLPFAILLLGWWKRGRIGTRDVVPLLPFFSIGAILGSLTAWMEVTRVGARGQEWSLTALERLLVAGRAPWFYGWKLLWPFNLTFNYPRWQLNTSDPLQYFWLLAAIGVLVALWRTRDRVGRGPLTALLFFIGTLVPALGFFNVYPFRYSFVADHFQYLASIGVIALVVAVLHRATTNLRSKHQWLSTGLAVMLLAALASRTWSQAQHYRDIETLWIRTLEANSQSWLANNNLGNLILRRGDVRNAESHFRRALIASPTYRETHSNLAVALMRQGRTQEAADYALQAVQIDPYFADGWNTLGNARLLSGELESAVSAFLQALEMEPQHADAHANLGAALTQSGHVAEAESHLRQALDLDPELATAHSNLGILLAAGDRLDEAIFHFERALALDPHNRALQENLGRTQSLRQQKLPNNGWDGR